MDAVTLLEQDHRTVEGLFRRYESLDGDDEARTQIVREVIRELSIHAAIEEQIFYPAVRDVLAGGDSMTDEALHEHQEAKEALAELDRMEASDPEFDQRVRELIADVRHHVREEETEMLPQLEAAVPRSRLEELGERMESAKATAPTRPHPHAPSTPGNLVAGPAAAVVDRVRDAASGRSRTPTRNAGRAARSTPSRTKTSAGRTRKTATTRAKKATTASRSGRTTSAKGPVIHVTTDPKGGWRAEKQGSSRATARSDSKQEVVKRARELARSQRGRLVIHGRDGRIQEERTYGPDPSRSKG